MSTLFTQRPPSLPVVRRVTHLLFFLQSTQSALLSSHSSSYSLCERPSRLLVGRKSAASDGEEYYNHFFRIRLGILWNGSERTISFTGFTAFHKLSVKISRLPRERSTSTIDDHFGSSGINLTGVSLGTNSQKMCSFKSSDCAAGGWRRFLAKIKGYGTDAPSVSARNHLSHSNYFIQSKVLIVFVRKVDDCGIKQHKLICVDKRCLTSAKREEVSFL